MKFKFFKIFIVIFYFLHPYFAKTQNLVTNGDFEIYSNLPTRYGQSYLAVGWNNVNGIYVGFTGSPDYFHLLANYGTYFGQITPISGSAQMGFATYLNTDKDFREYISTKFSSPMVAGQQYQISFYITQGNDENYTMSSNGIGVNLSTIPLTQGNNTFIPVSPQIEIPSIVTQKGSWQQYVFTFIAGSAFNYITIGNFRNDANTSVSSGLRGAYYFIDKIEVTPSCNLLNFNLGNDTTLCEGTSLTLNAATVNGTYLWQDNSTSSIYKVTQPGTYWVKVTSGCGSITDTLKVNYQSVPGVNLGNDTTLCKNAALTLDATNANATYLWQDGSTGARYQVTQAGIYWVKASNSCGSKTDTVTITVINNSLSAVDLGRDTVLCEGTTLILNATSTNAAYLWQDNSTTPTYTVTQPGKYWVKVIGACESKSDTINVLYKLFPAINLGKDTTLCQGSKIVLNATSINAAYLWQDNSTGPTYTVTQPGTYWAKVTNSCGSKIDTVLIANKNNCICNLYIPNAFTPNGDNFNDKFFPVSNCRLSEFEFMVFNRWGEKIFETKKISSPWDGRFMGQPCETGSYVYILSYKFENDNITNKKKGNVYLIR
ncbi:MAG: gliding motility-associated C-terminal domain-containing protein [Chitinophagaceae bacterium]|nr:gliding motility-associated C-terminal domain-containing protein [Chitinophagaceae bacterium]